MRTIYSLTALLLAAPSFAQYLPVRQQAGPISMEAHILPQPMPRLAEDGKPAFLLKLNVAADSMHIERLQETLLDALYLADVDDNGKPIYYGDTQGVFGGMSRQQKGMRKSEYIAKLRRDIDSAKIEYEKDLAILYESELASGK